MKCGAKAKTVGSRVRGANHLGHTVSTVLQWKPQAIGMEEIPFVGEEMFIFH
jgi:hypothetical protein